MRRRHPLPRLWLMTDERMGDRLWAALERLPRGTGVVFRHYALPRRERQRLFTHVAKIARRRGLVLVVAGDQWLGRSDGRHNVRPFMGGLYTVAVHSRTELVIAIREAADLIFVSPVFPTRSHPGQSALGAIRLGLLIRNSPIPMVALGGMSKTRFRRLRGLNLHGWAGIDSFL